MLRKLLIIMLALFTAMPFAVKADEEERIVLKQEEYIIDGNDVFEIAYELYPETMNPKDLQVVVTGDAAALHNITEGGHQFVTVRPGTATITLSTPGGASATAKVTVNDVIAESIAFKEPEYTFGVNNLIQLPFESEPAHAFYEEKSAVSSDDSIVKIEGFFYNQITARVLKEGDCTVTVTVKTQNGETLTAETIIHAVFKPVEGITIPITEYTGLPGTKSFTYHLIPEDASERTVTVTSSNPEVVQVPETTDTFNFNIALLKEGEAVITLTTANGATGTIHVTVKAEEVTNLRWLTPTIDVPLGGTSASILMTIPNNGSVEGIVFTSSDEEVAKVTAIVGKGVVIDGLKEGTAEITAALPNGLSAVLTVNVAYVEPEDIVDLEEEVTLEGKGQTKAIKFSGRPTGYSPTGLSVSSDNPEVAEAWLEQYKLWVKSGNPGTANVTMTLPNGNTYTSKVTVTEVKAEEIAFDEEGPITVMEDETGTASYTCGPENANSPITVTVEDPSIAEITLENDGSVSFKGLKAGTTTLTVAADENVKDTITIVVEENPDKDLAACTVFGFCEYEGKMYWYEEGKRQGVYGDEKNITDTQFGIERGREIYDPDTDAWYWLDAVNDGAAAYDKEVWIPYIFQEETPGSTEGKWVRYDDHGQMVKGWYACDAGVYYYDKLTGAMYKGEHEIEGKTYFFDELTGIRQ